MIKSGVLVEITLIASSDLTKLVLRNLKFYLLYENIKKVD